jgi:conjugal transfer mating pair stabilization protein TraN
LGSVQLINSQSFRINTKSSAYYQITIPNANIQINGIGFGGTYNEDTLGSVQLINSQSFRINTKSSAYYQITINVPTCTTGTLENGQCKTTTTTLTCPIGYTETTGAETLKGECKTNQNYTYYNYICNTGYNPIDSGGNIPKTDPNYTSINDLTNDLNSETSPLNNCKKKRFTCLSNPERGCALVDSKMQCSPFPCIGNPDIQNLGTVEGENDKNNDGWANDGSCEGQLYIFNGEDKRCRASDKIFGLTGGGCCDKDKVFMGLVACKDNEKLLAKKRQNNNCHYVGQYCSKKLKFLGCIQTSESYCCFNSKLGRIIQEQGRPQLNKSWGEADSPDCKGFTPDEFQKLDFSKLDFTEFAKDIQTKTTNFNNIGGFVQNKVQNFFQQ